ncbi:MAG: acetyl-CoA carboxylase biotin carboxyl carrier protein subunit [Ignavibacteriae bacterium]|nr:MAG: acetyl-CoA carboxylase biotin carboxyl carrier protein subunit [Ignavibacteriota bacterium]
MKQFEFTLNGNKYDVNILNFEGNIVELDINGTKYNVEVNKQAGKAKTPQIVRAKTEAAKEPDKSYAMTSSPAEKKGTGHIKAPLPGTIISVFVKEGDYIKRGTKLLTWEAMKMENNLNSDREGTIKTIKVKPGDIILEGDILIEIE